MGCVPIRTEGGSLVRGLPWFRVYVQLFSNPKVGTAVAKHGECLGWRLVGLWALASASAGYLPSDINYIAFWLRISADEATLTIDRLKSERLIDETDRGLKIHDWDTWQFTSDSSTARVWAHRDNKKRSGRESETLPETFHETEVQRSSNGPNRTDTKQSREEHTLARDVTSIGLHQFLAAYPKKTKRDAAARAYISIVDSREDHESLMAGLNRWIESDQWKRSIDSDGGRFIPDPDKFIMERRWLDEPEPYSAEEDKFERAARLALNEAA